MASYGITETVHCCKCPNQKHDLENQDRRDAEVKEDLEFMWSDPDQRQRYQAKDPICQETRRCQPGRMNVVRYAFFEVRPDGFKTYVDAVATDPGLYRIPDEREKNAVVDDERASVHAPYISVGDGESEVVECARHAVEDYLQ